MARKIRCSEEGSIAKFPRLLLPEEAARALGVTEHTLDHWRSDGFGPKYVRVGRLIRYAALDIAEWVRTRSVAPGPKPPSRASGKTQVVAKQKTA